MGKVYVFPKRIRLKSIDWTDDKISMLIHYVFKKTQPQ